MTGDPYRALGLTPDPGLTDDDIRSAWHRVAAATHPDRADGGHPAVFSAAAAAYSDLRTPFGRGEALADLARSRSLLPRLRLLPRPARLPRLAQLARPTWPALTTRSARLSEAPGRTQPPGYGTWPGVLARRMIGRVRYGRPVRLAALVLVSAAVCVAAVTVTGWQPASVALTVGAATWILRGGRRYLSARPLAAPSSPSRDDG
jgi:hypothetical protein